MQVLKLIVEIQMKKPINGTHTHECIGVISSNLHECSALHHLSIITLHQQENTHFSMEREMRIINYIEAFIHKRIFRQLRGFSLLVICLT
jgi:hypothetical protein